MNALDELNKVIAAWESYKTNPSTATLTVSGEMLKSTAAELAALRTEKKYMDDLNKVIADQNTSLQQRIATLEAAIVWALGYTNFGESSKPINAPAFWWRKELRERSEITQEEIQSILAATEAK